MPKFNDIINDTNPTNVLTFNSTTGDVSYSPKSITDGTIVAKTPYNAPPDTVISFDNLQLKWHGQAGSFDGIAIKSTATTNQSIRFSCSETYYASVYSDLGKILYGTTNQFYNLPMLSGFANVGNPTYPHAYALVPNVFMGMGNPGMPNSDTRTYKLYNDTTQSEYIIYTDKQASTGEVITAQTGTCSIIVQKIR
jgi:hypothetical protein